MSDDAGTEDVTGYLQAVYEVRRHTGGAEMGRIAPRDPTMEQMARWLA